MSDRNKKAPDGACTVRSGVSDIALLRQVVAAEHLATEIAVDLVGRIRTHLALTTKVGDAGHVLRDDRLADPDDRAALTACRDTVRTDAGPVSRDANVLHHAVHTGM